MMCASLPSTVLNYRAAMVGCGEREIKRAKRRKEINNEKKDNQEKCFVPKFLFKYPTYSGLCLIAKHQFE